MPNYVETGETKIYTRLGNFMAEDGTGNSYDLLKEERSCHFFQRNARTGEMVDAPQGLVDWWIQWRCSGQLDDA